jgi:site-specific DNA recombinase
MKTIRAAIYARKSTEQNVSDDAKSVTRQLELARAFAKSKGWNVVAEYGDEGISGRRTKRLKGRAQMLMAAANGEFEIVLVRDTDRLSRDDKEVDPVVLLDQAGVQVWEYLEGGRRIDVRDSTQRLVRNIHRFKNTKESEDASKRTREQKLSRYGKVANVDGSCYGYRNVGDPKNRRREIDPKQAKVIVRIFEMSVFPHPPPPGSGS